MIISEIIQKEDNFTQEEMEFVVEQYIFEKKNVRVKIVITPIDIFVFGESIFQRQINLLLRAYVIARDYYLQQ